MKTIILLFSILISFISFSQAVKPVISPDYLLMIRNDSANLIRFQPDTLNSINSSRLRGTYYGYRTIQKIGIKNNQVIFKPVKPQILLITGSFNAFAETRSVNRLPAIQGQYSQGRSEGGKLEWKGPETNEMFSYGPDVKTLEFDGSNYEYDLNGRLVTRGNGNGKPAQVYDNGIFKNAFLNATSLSLQAKYKRNYADFLSTSFKLGRTNENPFLPYGSNKTGYGIGSIEFAIKRARLTGSYRAQSTGISKANRNGYLNRVYQNALLTPVSFSNQQEIETSTDQRSYSQFSDNPLFLLTQNKNALQENHKIASLGFESISSPLKIKLNQSIESSNLDHTEIYKPGTAFFELGQLVDRTQNNRNYCLQSNANYDLGELSNRFKASAALNYVFTTSRTGINYFHGGQYNYERNSHDVSASFLGTLEGNNYDAEAKIENKVYASNTSGEISVFLPAVSAGILFPRLLNDMLRARVSGRINYFHSELPINQSYAPTSTLFFQSQDALQYMPLQEVQTFNHLGAIRNRDVSVRTGLLFKNKLGLNAEFFQHWICNDVFPVLSNNKLYLLNLASHKNQGIELELSWNTKSKNWTWNNALSFTSYKSRVTNVREGFNHLPFTGFNNIHKSIVAGQPLGVIEGKAFLRDANHRVIIGNDGFPVVDPEMQIIGDPNPDFVMKLWNGLSWKNLTCNVNLEWKKGGDIWNGTAATLDYYGMSKTSADYRNVTGYVFDGVTQAGHTNTTPVSFYDPSLPVTNNRWTRNGFGGIDEEYIQKADWIRIDNLSFSYKLTSRKYLQSILLSVYTNNILVWSPYKGGDPAQLFYDQPNSMGLDFFNLPSMKQFGLSITLQF